MFTNIGGKIKCLAKIICWIGIIASLIGGIVMMRSGSDAGNAVSIASAIAGLLVIVIGSLASWVSSFTLYGFGELIETNSQIARDMAELKRQNNGDRFAD